MSATSTANLLSSLQIQTHDDVEAQLQSAQRLLAERRYRQAEEQVKLYMAETQKAIKEAAAAKAAAAAAGADAAAAPSAASSSSLPTLSQLMTAFLPFLRQVSQLRRENESAEYDVQTMADEVARFKAAQAQQAASGDASAAAPRATRVLHADYVHPQLKLASIAGRSRGVIAVAPGLPDGCAAPASSSSDDAAPAADAATVCIPANTTLMVSKAIGFVSSPTAAVPTSSAGTPADATTAHEEAMANALVTLLALKMGGEASLIPEVYQLDAGERYEEDRERRLARVNSPLDAYRPIPALAAPQPPHEAEADSSDLEIDLARLALIVARNSFAPPQPPEPDSDESESAAPRQPMQSTGLWLPCSFINHACRPNAHWFCVGDYMFVRTLRAINAGEEVTISYTGFDAKLYTTRRDRCAGWGFECRCAAWCEPFLAHPHLAHVESQLVAEVAALEPRVHALVDAIHATDDATVAHRNALADLRAAKAQLEKCVDQFKALMKNACDAACKDRGVTDENEADDAIALLSATTTSKSSKSSAPSAAATMVVSHPRHTRCALVHLHLPLSLLALCAVSLHDSASATAKSYRASLKKHEDLTLASIDLLSRQYGSGDETAIFAWLEMINTWMQFAAAGIEYRSVEEMKAIMNDIVIARHCAQFGVKMPHFRATWMELMDKMGLAELLE